MICGAVLICMLARILARMPTLARATIGCHRRVKIIATVAIGP